LFNDPFSNAYVVKSRMMRETKYFRNDEQVAPVTCHPAPDIMGSTSSGVTSLINK